MSKFLISLKWELLVQNKVNNFTKYLFSFFLFCTISIALVNAHEDIKKFGLIFTVIYIPISLIGFTSQIFKADIEDGSMEFMLLNFSTTKLSLIKYFALFINATLSYLINIPVIYLAFNPSFYELIQITIILFLVLMLACALLILIASVQCYFRSNTNFLPLLIMSMIIPNIIISGLILQDPASVYLVFILIGINMILIPILIILTSYLVKNIYNLDS
jgi:heme exporter protein B